MGIENINWYPGHMKKTRELIAENLKLVDAVIELRDARIPVSSRNPIIDELIHGKRRVVLLNKRDLADADENRKWETRLRGNGVAALTTNGTTGDGVRELLRLMADMRDEINAASARNKALRAMIVGIPNVGKSSLINRLAGRKSAKTGNKPGVTRGKQWLGIADNMQLLDTPGILWPKFEDPKVGLNLAFCGSIKDEISDTESLAFELAGFLSRTYPRCLMSRYALTEAVASGGDALAVMDAVAAKRGFVLSGGRLDYARVARTLLDEFMGGLIGRISLEKAETDDSRDASRAAAAEEGRAKP